MSDLRTLTKENAKGVGAHLVMVARLLDDDIDAARAHADAAVRRAGRVPAVREARGLVAYHEGDWNVALAEFRTARRLSGSHHLLPYLVDCERALGRPEKALDLARSPEASTLGTPERAELMIVRSGIRRDMGQGESALAELEGPHLVPGGRESWAPRLYYAYADALLGLGRVQDARTWFTAAAEADPDLTTDAWERLDELDGTIHLDLLEGALEGADDDLARTGEAHHDGAAALNAVATPDDAHGDTDTGGSHDACRPNGSDDAGEADHREGARDHVVGAGADSALPSELHVESSDNGDGLTAVGETAADREANVDGNQEETPAQSQQGHGRE